MIATFPELVAEDVRLARGAYPPREMITISGEMLVTAIGETIVAARQVARRGNVDDSRAYVARLALLGAACQLVAEAIIAERKGVF